MAVIDWTTGSEFKNHVEEADAYQSAINTIRDTLKPFKPHRQVSILADASSSILCELGDRNASGMLAASWFGVLCREAMAKINTVFPLGIEEGMP